MARLPVGNIDRRETNLRSAADLNSERQHDFSGWRGERKDRSTTCWRLHRANVAFQDTHTTAVNVQTALLCDVRHGDDDV